MTKTMQTSSPSFYLTLVTAVCICVLIAAYILENYFGVLPCQLCLFERSGFIAATVISGLSLFLKGSHQRYILFLLAIGFLGEAALATYHVAVQYHFVNPPTFCTPPSLDMNGSLEDIRDQMLNTKAVPCDVVTWTLFGLSLAAYNALLSLVLSLFCWMGVRKTA